MFEKIAEDIFTKIRDLNSKDTLESIPNSDTFEKLIFSQYGFEKNEMEKALILLRDSHRIFTIELIKEDKKNNINKIEGYVLADLATVKRLKIFFQAVLTSEYEKLYKKRLGVHQIQKEIYTRMELFKNRPIGLIANKAIMLEEFEFMIEKNFLEYTDEWKKNRFRELLNSPEYSAPKTAPKDMEEEISEYRVVPKNKRAVDTEANADFAAVTSPQALKRMLSIYGIETFFRIHLRKCNFELIEKVIESGEVNRKADLKNLKDMIEKVKGNCDKDPNLSGHAESLAHLERSLSRRTLLARA